MYVLFLLFLFLTPNETSAEVYACHNVDGDTYTESPQRADCRLLDIQPPALGYERTYTFHLMASHRKNSIGFTI